MENSIYAPQRTVTDLSDCYFYHTMEIPGHGVVDGFWDLRKDADKYLGGVDFKGKRVLEIGPANGFLTIEMERRGADVVACDLCPELNWDTVPYYGFDHARYEKAEKAHLGQLNKAFWLTHTAYKSKSKVVYTHAYDLPSEIGSCDIAILGSVLLHMRDPIRALQKVASFVTDKIIVTDMMPNYFKKPPLYGKFFLFKKLYKPIMKPVMVFLPEQDKKEPLDTWWNISPEIIAEFLKVLGFPKQKISYHAPAFKGNATQLYTIVGER